MLRTILTSPPMGNALGSLGFGGPSHSPLCPPNLPGQVSALGLLELWLGQCQIRSHLKPKRHQTTSEELNLPGTGPARSCCWRWGSGQIRQDPWAPGRSLGVPQSSEKQLKTCISADSSQDSLLESCSHTLHLEETPHPFQSTAPPVRAGTVPLTPASRESGSPGAKEAWVRDCLLL